MTQTGASHARTLPRAAKAVHLHASRRLLLPRQLHVPAHIGERELQGLHLVLQRGDLLLRLLHRVLVLLLLLLQCLCHPLLGLRLRRPELGAEVLRGARRALQRGRQLLLGVLLCLKLHPRQLQLLLQLLHLRLQGRHLARCGAACRVAAAAAALPAALRRA